MYFFERICSLMYIQKERLLQLDFDGVTEVFGFFAYGLVNEYFNSGEFLTDLGLETVVGRYVFGVETNGVEPKGMRYIDGSLVVELLRDDGKGLLPEDMLHAHDRIMGSETGVVEVDALGRDTRFNKFVFHVLGLIVVFLAVVATHYDGFYLARLVEFYGCRNAVIEVLIGCATAQMLRCA